MKKQKDIRLSLSFLVAFALWTILVSFVDVQLIGPQDSAVGFATINKFFHNLTGTHIFLYHITDWLGLVPVAFGLCFAVFGLVQWVKRKHILKVDGSILSLGIFYLVVLGAYLFFERVVVNYRPVLIAGYLEASYPSSTTLLTLCVMSTAESQLCCRIKSRWPTILVRAFIAFMVIGRLLSGVHWLTDIVGGILLSAGLIKLYDFLTKWIEGRKEWTI